MKDAGQKHMLYQHFRAQGWYALLEVPVYYGRGYESKPKLVTDIDVLGIRPSGDLGWEFIIGDCKTRRAESPANRVLWVRGLMEHFKATRAFVLLKHDQGIERDHKLFGDSHRVTLIEESEFDLFDRCTIYPSGSKSFPETAQDCKRIREEVPSQYPGLSDLAAYINKQAWNEPDLITAMRKTLGACRSARGELDPGKPGHLALALETASVFGIGLASCVGTISHQYLLPNDAPVLDHALKVLIWGGRENYEYISGLRNRLMEARGVGPDDGGLALPEWGGFMQLVRSFLVAPKLAFRMPQVLRGLAVDLITEREPLGNHEQPVDLMLLKLCMNTALYVVAAGGFPADAASRIRNLFFARMAALTSPQTENLGGSDVTPSQRGAVRLPAVQESPTGALSATGDAKPSVTLQDLPAKRMSYFPDLDARVVSDYWDGKTLHVQGVEDLRGTVSDARLRQNRPAGVRVMGLFFGQGIHWALIADRTNIYLVPIQEPRPGLDWITEDSDA